MTVFKKYLKILYSYKFNIILYTVMLIIFGTLNMNRENTDLAFTSSKPDILIINKDENKGITKELINYLEKNSNIIEVEQTEEKINDALFYRDVNYIIYIPENFREEFIKGNTLEIEIKSTNDYPAHLASNLLSRYLSIAETYRNFLTNEEEIIKNINETLKITTEVEITSNLDSDGLNRAKTFYNFANYTMLAGCIYIICLIMTTFNKEQIRKRTIISSTNYKSLNRKLLISNSIFALMLWIIYVILSFILVGKSMASLHGLLFIINSLIFTIMVLSLSFLIGNLTNNKEAINGMVNVIALGSSFLCGSFVPMEYLPSFVLKIAHILPSYWYIKTNEIISTLENFNWPALKQVVTNLIVLIIFAIIFIILSNITTKRKRKIA